MSHKVYLRAANLVSMFLLDYIEYTNMPSCLDNLSQVTLSYQSIGAPVSSFTHPLADSKMHFLQVRERHSSPCIFAGFLECLEWIKDHIPILLRRIDPVQRTHDGSPLLSLTHINHAICAAKTRQYTRDASISSNLNGVSGEPSTLSASGSPTRSTSTHG
ncbi:hypothetical protein KCU71_g3, partial [Aureobasidium melanogenum]